MADGCALMTRSSKTAPVEMKLKETSSTTTPLLSQSVTICQTRKAPDDSDGEDSKTDIAAGVIPSMQIGASIKLRSSSASQASSGDFRTNVGVGMLSQMQLGANSNFSIEPRSSAAVSNGDFRTIIGVGALSQTEVGTAVANGSDSNEAGSFYSFITGDGGN